jgi:hypothetical protein
MFFGMIAGTFVMNARTRRRVGPLAGPWGDIFNGMAKGLDISMVGLLVASIFMSVLFWPVYWMSFALSVALSETSRRMALRVPQPVRNPRVARMGGRAPALARLGRS